EATDDAGLENLLFSVPVRSPDRVEIARASRPFPDLPHIHKELQHPHVILQLLWEEYRETYPDEYQYSHFCQLYSKWSRKLDVTPRVQSRRQAFRRLCRAHRPDRESHLRRSSKRLSLRSRAGCEQLHVCGSHLVAGDSVLDHLAHTGF